ncbi:hypothetical protein SERLA73DRAFT_75390 [Serpula lacrymans var. lacrymans S7.3]|uniref:Myb/SANT-like domain-containing protein n=2 Tax=Serpula lacrymans var. lacrymans TaxID=341189 RepID=F8Q3I6_SERL3|nr:uncharacterized protein SERLADRAFT_440066 [Serpula lacrymans var. lacrymans S7.9]EGN97747.1 hypothetical protein SERLA73DRAFT_75390 [Serpula lacrymans var. lacrymans S7.3]EGO23335.1 hypothetical protein SERLADRAFT_440066 [Serpula lacrymans var. lacrymans S7.9]
MTSQKLTLKISSMKDRLLANKKNQSPKDDATLVDKLKEAQMEGNRPDNNFKKPAFVATAVVLVQSHKTSGGAPKISTNYSRCWGTLKAMCLVVQQLQELSGFGWDDTRKKVTAEEDVWDNYIAPHPEAKPWRTNPLPLYNDIIRLIDGHYATGEGAFYIPEIGEPSLPLPHPYKEQVDQDDVGTADGHPESDLDLDGEEKSQDSIEVSQRLKCKHAASGSPTPASASKCLHTKVTGPSAILGIADALSAGFITQSS